MSEKKKAKAADEQPVNQEEQEQEVVSQEESDTQTQAPDQEQQSDQEGQPEDGEQPQEEPEKSQEELLGEELEQVKDLLGRTKEQLARTMTEYDNFRKRTQREKEAIYPQATANAVCQFVPIMDTFERALEAPCGDDKFKEGVEMIYQHFMETLKKLGVEEFGAPGEPFDPNMHNSVMHIEDDTLAENSIVEVFQKGYRMGDRIIRHAMVKVAN